MGDGDTFVVFRTFLDGAEYVNNYAADSAAAAVKRAHEEVTGRTPTTVEEIDVQGEYMVFPYEALRSFGIEEGERDDRD